MIRIAPLTALIALAFLVGLQPGPAGAVVLQPGYSQSQVGDVDGRTRAWGIATADFNGDGHTDFISGDTFGDIHLFTSNGDGTFTDHGVVINQSFHNAYAVAAGDFNNDGHADFVLTKTGGTGSTGDGEVTVYTGNGDGTFNSTGFPQEGIVIGDAGTDAVALTAGDVDGDGDIDIITGDITASDNARADITLFRNQLVETGSFTFTEEVIVSAENLSPPDPEQPPYFPPTSYLHAYGLALGDVDGDGDADLLVTDRAAYLYVYENDGSGSFAPIRYENVPGRPFVFGRLHAAFHSHLAITAADLNDDGTIDFATGGDAGDWEGMVDVWLNEGLDGSGNPTFLGAGIVGGAGTDARGLATGQLNPDVDGYPDIVFGNFEGDLYGLFGDLTDTDGDGIIDAEDNCPATFNPAQLRLDRENAVQLDTDGDGAGDACDDDDDGDGIVDADDNCLLTPNADQADVDGDGRGDACDPKDDRDGHPGVGSYEFQQAERIEWGRKPVIILRADALSLSFRREIAETLATEALERDIAFSMAVIPWDEERFAPTLSADFLNSVASDQNFEIVQHGTYHTCVLDSGVGPEFNCGMDFHESFNLMRVGHDSLQGSVDFSDASHQLSGFIPPEDGFDDAATEAMMALGYNYIASAWWAEAPNFIHVDDNGLVHVPWSQTACGNGAATFINCQTTNLEAHSGVDCDVEEICKPYLGPNAAKDYEPWSDYADNSLVDRCRYDMMERYGVCSLLFELTVYDAGGGVLDPTAIEGYEIVLDELLDLQEETGAVFMTLGDYAASQLIEDTQAPDVTINAPESIDYEHHETVEIDFEVTDDLSGVYSVDATLDGTPVADGDTINMLDLSLGEHTLAVTAEDTAGNVTEETVTFNVIATFDSLRALIESLLQSGEITDPGVASSMIAKVDAAEDAYERGNTRAAANALNALLNEINAQSGKKISEEAAELLRTDIMYVLDSL